MKHAFLILTAFLVAACGENRDSARGSAGLPSSEQVANTASRLADKAREAVTPNDGNVAGSNAERGAQSSGSSGASNTGSSGSSSGEYVVAPGDTLVAIARKHDVSTRDLADWNNIDNPNQIRAGQKLRTSAP